MKKVIQLLKIHENLTEKLFVLIRRSSAPEAELTNKMSTQKNSKLKVE